MADRSLGHRAPLLWLVLPYAAGLIAAKHGFAPPPAVCLGVAGLALGVAGWAAGRRFALWAVAIAFAGALAGGASYNLHRARLPDWAALPPREANLTLRVDRIFDSAQVNRVTGLATIVGADAHLPDLPGQRIYFSLRLEPGAPAPIRSAEIRTIGVLELLPAAPPGDTFAGYLADAGMNFRLTRGRLLAVTKLPTAYRAFCARAAGHLASLLSLGVESKQPELTAVYRAMLLGRKNDLSPEQGALFMQSGTMHLFAISGLHIGVIAIGLQALLLLLRLRPGARFGLGLLVLWLYVDVTGGMPSAVRAFWMVALLQASLILRVPANPLAALATSALAVLCLEPMQLFSASFQLSYGIVAALLLLGLPLGAYWTGRWPLFADLPRTSWRRWQHWAEARWRNLLTAFGIGLASILISLPAGVQFFKLFTPGALLANLVLIPVASIAILAGMGSLLCGLAGLTAGSLLCNHAAVLILRGIDTGIRALVAWPGVFHAATFRAPWIGPATLGLVLASLLYGYAVGWTRRRGGWWPPFALAALALIFGVNFG
ncbi:MAG: ComEC/Rec2 family competence protein [Opitutales bacterium]